MKSTVKTFIVMIVMTLMFALFSMGVQAKALTCYQSGCTRLRNSDSAYCSLHKYSYNRKKSSSSKSSSKKKSSTKSKKKHRMPDCDDYESYEEFMDEWDGYMPDGSDAEDYWGNW